MSGPELTIEFITHLTLRASELDMANDVLVIDGATKALKPALRVKLWKESSLSWPPYHLFGPLHHSNSDGGDGDKRRLA